MSTNEVGEILNSFEQVNMANVYGVKVPHSEGRAGMVAFNCDPNTFDWNAFSSFVDEKLPSYARPVFVRIIEEMETTGTFKLKKGDLREEASSLRSPFFNLNVPVVSISSIILTKTGLA